MRYFKEKLYFCTGLIKTDYEKGNFHPCSGYLRYYSMRITPLFFRYYGNS